MDESICTGAISPLRQRLIDDLNVRRFIASNDRCTARRVRGTRLFSCGASGPVAPAARLRFQ